MARPQVQCSLRRSNKLPLANDQIVDIELTHVQSLEGVSAFKDFLCFVGGLFWEGGVKRSTCFSYALMIQYSSMPAMA